MSYHFDGKVCLITGAASGIGRATAQKMASLGARLSLSYINFHGLAETDRLCGGNHMAEVFDVASAASCEAFLIATISTLGRLDFVFNCAGVNPTAYALTDTSDEYWDKLVNTNLRGTYNITRAAIPRLGPGSAIVNIRVNAVAPGYIATPSNAGMVAGPAVVAEQEKGIAIGRFGTAGEVADVVAFLFSDESRYMSGSIVEVSGGRT
ncbi:hypothetical protein M433DRAFT_169951 [Acidomyces richmondensis BFW]|nr:hypothetical protein M433DRAFT_169951 [Acidomyces richmondensis BFW]